MSRYFITLLAGWFVSVVGLRPATAGAQTFGVAVTPAETTITVPGDSRQTQRFWVKNTGTAGMRNYVIMGPACNWPVRDCVWSTFGLWIAQGDSGAVDVTFTAGPNGTTGNTHFDAKVNDQQSVSARGVVFVQAASTPPPDGITVTPSSGTEEVPPYVQARQKTFVVRNTSGRTVDVSIQGADCQPFEMFCSFSTQSINGLAPNAEAPVTVTFTSGPPGWSGTIALVAKINDNQSVAASAAVTVTVPVQPWLETKSLNPGTTNERSACVTFPVATNSAYECGDLVIAHAMPSLRVRGDDRTPVLRYVSTHGTPTSVVAATVSAPNGGATDVTASLTVQRGGSDVQVVAPTSFGSIVGGSTRRISLAYDASSDTTGVYPYTLTVTMNVGGIPDTLTSSDTLVVVNRRNSAFGGGWWLARYEQLVRLPGGDFLWVGGDGSTRRYVRDTLRAGEAYGAVGFVRPDSLVLDGSVYVRQLRHRARVEFDANGRHVATKEPHGVATTFQHDPSGRLEKIIHPTASHPFHQFFYNVTSGRLDSVTGPGPNGGTRRTRFHLENGAVLAITDPDGRFVQFGYNTHPGFDIITRVNRNGYVSGFTLASHRLVESNVPLADPNQDAIITVCPAEIRGLPDNGCDGGSVAVDSAVTVIDGPRVDANDVSRVRTDRFGAPVVITDPLGNSLRLFRGDRGLAGLVTRVVHKNGWVNEARYDARGLLVARIEYGPLGPGGDAVTSYTWDPKWERVTSVTFPEQNTVSFAYDGNTGNRLWQQAGPDAARRVDFTYYGSGVNGEHLLASVIHAPDAQAARARDSLIYDPLGNLAETRQAVGTSSEGVTRLTNDAVGRPIRTSVDIVAGGAQQQRDSTEYDLMDRVVRTRSYGFGTTPAETLFTASTYNAEGNRRRLARWSVPDITASPIDTIITRWGYDQGERMVADTAPDGQVERRVYDHASNATSVTTRRGKTLTMQYDPLNRLVTRTVPSVTYDSTLIGIGALDNEPYPRRPNDGTAYTIGGDVETFGYDAAGRLTTAHNADAHVTRDYFASGLLKSERLEVRNARTSGFGHNYFTQYGYDLNGRRTLIRLPSQLATGTADSVAFTYDAATGELTSVRDPLDRDYMYAYTLRGEPRALSFPGGYEERWSYFPDGTLRTDSIHNAGGTGGGRIPMSVLRATAFTYDRRGKRLTADDAVGYQELNRFAYNGLGYVTSAYLRQNAKLFVSGGEFADQYTSGEQQTYDALGNIASALTVDTLRRNGVVAQSSRRGRTAVFERNVGRLLSETSLEGSKRYTYDASGNLESSIREEGTSQEEHPREDRFTYYDAQERARAVDFRSAFPGGADLQLKKWTFEEYRYDALGRRVWVLSDRDCREDRSVLHGVEWVECNVGTLRRTVWDGEQELIEIQVPYRLPGGAPQPDSVLENDGYVAQLPRFASGIDPNPYFGRVLYVHGLALDQPVAIVRYNYVDFAFSAQNNYVAFPPTGFSLFWNALGRLGPVACGNGQANCEVTSGGRTAAMGMDVPSNWFVLDRPKVSPAPRFFQGSLLADKQDATGVLYRRNRYYDPSTGRFTQEDPIGLAGGLNLYGFANGDPVNFSDPFGLARCPPVCGDVFADLARRLAPLENVLNAVGEVTGVNDLGRAGDDIAGGHAIRGGISIAMAVPGVGAGGRLGVKAAVAFHHAWPKYLGGAHQQLLEVLPRELHNAYHSGLDKILPRQAGGGYYQNLSRAQLRQVYRDFEAYTRGFDREYGTRLWEAARREGFR